MPIVRIDARRVGDFESFHDVFAQVFGFPEFYGRNLDAWIDCMTCLDDPESRMTTIHGSPSDPVTIQVDHVDHMHPNVLDALNQCASFVNWRWLDMGGSAILALAYHRSRRSPDLEQ